MCEEEIAGLDSVGIGGIRTGAPMVCAACVDDEDAAAAAAAEAEAEAGSVDGGTATYPARGAWPGDGLGLKVLR